MGESTKVPSVVLVRARALAEASSARPAPPAPPPKARKLLPREKVVRALKKLHPMD